MSKLAALFMSSPEETPLPILKASPGKPSEEEKGYGILFVDDEANVLKAMRRIFRQENYRVYTAGNGEEALAILEDHAVQVIVSDYQMPGMTGADLLRRIKARRPETIRIMLTGHADVNAVMGAVNDGAVYKFITKPWNDEDLRLTVSLALEQHDLLQANRQLTRETGLQKKKIKELSRFVNLHRSQLGTMLVKQGFISTEDLQRALTVQTRSKKILPLVLVEMGLVDEPTIMKVIQARLQINRVSPAEFSVPAELAALIPQKVCQRNVLLPLKKSDTGILVAMADPTDYAKIEDLKFMMGTSVQAVLASRKEIQDKIEEVFGDGRSYADVVSAVDLRDPTETIEIILDDEDEEADLGELLQAKDQPPAIRIVNAIISDALRHQASDIHIEPKTKYVMVRYRIDDLLRDKIHVPSSLHLSIVSRIKIMSELDIAERRRPQDGRITVKTSSRMVDMRISTLPTINGEKVVMRVLDKNAAAKDLTELGLQGNDLERVAHFIQQPQGIILTTGPTGSGKTTTLYALLREGARITKNFTTIEDPVEYHMGMAQQVNVREKIGLTFPLVLRSILRQDPNVIMLGEIRDNETAEVAFHAAMTGHLVLSTLHTNSSIAAITRLRDMGMKSYVISDALIGVVAQRLVRRNCLHCTESSPPEAAVLKSLRLTEWHASSLKGRGCERCNQEGFRGRVGLYEIFQVDREIKRLIHSEAPETELIRVARMAGMATLREDALVKIKEGQTTFEEVLRVLGPQDILTVQCRHCQAYMEERYPFCPYCGGVNSANCRRCQFALNEDWQVCPSCGTLRAESGVPTGRHEDRTTL